MAAEGEMDRQEIVHRKGYERFVGWMKWGTIICAILGLIVVFVIAE